MTRLTFSLLVLLIAVSSVNPVFAEGVGSMYLSFDPTERVTQAVVPVLELFDFYLVIEIDVEDLVGPHDGVLGYEGHVRLDPGILFSAISYQPEISANVTGSFQNGSLNLLVGTGECVQMGRGPAAVTHFRALLLDETDELFIHLGPSVPSSFGGTAPGFYSCSGDLYRFLNWDLDDHSQLKVTTAPLATMPSSFGAVKALYH